MEKKRNHLEHLGIARGFGILSVVMAHTFVPEIRGGNPVLSILFLFFSGTTMQLFMMLSGYLFERSYDKYRPQGSLRFCIGKVKTLVVPYLSMSVISYAGIALAFMVPQLANVLGSAGYAKVGLLEAIFQITTFENHIVSHLWFLPTIFLIQIASFLAGRFFSRLPGLLVAAVLFIAAHYLAMPTLVYRVCTLHLFFCIGRRMVFLDAMTQKKWLVLVLPACLLTFAVQQAGWLGWSIPLEVLMALVVGVAGAASYIAVSRIIAGTVAGRGVAWVGKNSFAIYLLHQPFIVSGVSGVLLMYAPLPHLAICAITLALGIALPYLADRYVISKAGLLRFMFRGEYKAKAKKGHAAGRDGVA